MANLQKHTTSPNRALGLMIRSCIAANCYSKWTISDINRLFLPPALMGQYSIYYLNDQLVGFATWAMLGEAEHNNMLETQADPTWSAWQSGTQPWVIDLVAIENTAALIVHELRYDVFKSFKGYVHGVKRDNQGKFLRIAKWPTDLQIKSRTKP